MHPFRTFTPRALSRPRTPQHVAIVDLTLTSTLAREGGSLAATEAAAEIIARSVRTRVGRPAVW